MEEELDFYKKLPKVCGHHFQICDLVEVVECDMVQQITYTTTTCTLCNRCLKKTKIWKHTPLSELHAHLNGSISQSTIYKLIKYHKDQRKDDFVLPEAWQMSIAKGEKRSLEECFDIFKLIHKLVDDTNAVKMVATDVVKEFAEDGVRYLEIRTTPRSNAHTGMSKTGYVNAVLSGVDEALHDNNDIIVRLLLSIDRRQSFQDAIDTVELALQHQSSSSHCNVVGIDLSGDPKVGNVSELLPALAHAKQNGLKLALHLAEILNNKETELLWSLPPDRIGHGTYLLPNRGGNQQIVDDVLKHKTPIEMCLTSNVKGRTVASYSEHHFSYWYKEGHPIVICTDDKGVFSTNLSDEYAILARTFDLGRHEIWRLSEAAIDYTFTSSTTKRQLTQLWKEIKSCII